MVEGQFRSLPGRGELSYEDLMEQLNKSIYEGADDGVALGCRQTSDKVQKDMRTGTMGDGQGVQEAGRWAARGLIVATNRTGVDEAPDILFQ